MSVSVDRVLGWTIDLNELLDRKEIQDLAYNDKFKKELENTKFVDDYQKYEKGHIRLILDGMSGEYAYLTWVIYGERCEDYDDSEFYDNLNVMLERFKAPDDIKNDMRPILKAIGHEELEDEIVMRAFRHFH